MIFQEILILLGSLKPFKIKNFMLYFVLDHMFALSGIMGIWLVIIHYINLLIAF